MIDMKNILIKCYKGSVAHKMGKATWSLLLFY